MSRTQNVIRNIRWGIVQKIVSIVLPFIVRTVLIYTLSTSYAGLDGLFTSVLTVLSLAELGLSNAIAYEMYKPVAEGDEKKICALLNVYRKAYLVIGCIILGLGLIAMPFMPFLIEGEVPGDINLYVLFLIYLLKTVISYFFYGYKACILSVNQREDVISKVSIVSRTLLQVLQCVILLIFRNYYMFIIVLPVFAVLENLLNNFWAKKLYPNYVPKGTIDPVDLKSLKKRVSGLLIWKIGSSTRNSLDSIAVSMFLGLVTVAIYNNYWYIIAGVSSVLSVVLTSMLASVGNKVAVDTPEANYKDFHRFQFIYMWIVGWFTICMLCLYQPFMIQWMGTGRIFPTIHMILFCYLFFMLKQGDINSVYYQAAGLWWEGKWRSIIEAVSNLILNFVLGYYFGVIGIIMATIVSYTIAYFYGSRFTFSCYFKNNRLKYFYIENFIYLIITAVCGFVTYSAVGWLTELMGNDYSGAMGILKSLGCLMICIVLPNVLFLIAYSVNNTTRGYIRYGSRSLTKFLGKNK